MTNPKPDPNCEDCSGTGEIETESVHLGRPYWKDGKIVCDVTGKGNWAMTQCPCVGEYDDSNISVLRQSGREADEVEHK